MKKMKKITSIATAFMLTQSMALTGATVVLADDTTNEDVNTSSELTATTQVNSLIVEPDSVSPITPGTITTPEAASAMTGEEIATGTAITFSDTEITVTEGDSTGYEINGTTLTITAAGTYYISGSCSNGQIVVEKEVEDVILVLNGLDLTNETAAPVYINKKAKVTLRVCGENVLSDTEANSDKSVIVAKGAKSKLTIDGKGSLTINGNNKNGIKANGTLVIDDGILNINAVDNGINNEVALTINDGYINITAISGDGIKSASGELESEDGTGTDVTSGDATGSITINGGTIVIDAYGDGIQALKELTINDGIFDITCYGGVETEDYDKDDDNYPSAKGIKAKGSYDIIDSDDNVITEEVEVTGQALTINGGTFYLNCAEDAIASGGDVNLTGGYFEIKAGDDAVHADYVTTIGNENGTDEDLYLLISASSEAIEGAAVNINSGTVRAYAIDDGVNAANSDLSNYDYQINVSGGNIYVSCSEGDGFDSNNSLTFNGGVTAVMASLGQNGGEGNPLDCDGNLTVNDGKVLGIGLASPMGGVPKDNNYIQFGSSMSGGMNGGGMPGGMGGNMGQNGDVPQMPGDVSRDAAGMQMPDDVSGSGAEGWNQRQMPNDVSGAGAEGWNQRQMPGDVSGETAGMQMPGDVSRAGMQRPDDISGGGAGMQRPDDISGGGAGMQMPGDISDNGSGTASNVSIKNNDTVAVYDEDGNEIFSTTARWLSATDSNAANFAIYSAKGVTTSSDYTLKINGTAIDDNNGGDNNTTKEVGDIDGDGTVDLTDVQLVLQSYLELTTLNDEQQKAADADGSGEVDLSDAQAILRIYLELED